MATCNGAPFLDAQLRSIHSQSHRHWNLFVSDDGSTDGSQDILDAFAVSAPVHTTCSRWAGPNRGLAANFMSLLRDPRVPKGPVALCDQDDVWLPHHLERGLEFVQAHCEPAVYSARSIVTNAKLQPLPQTLCKRLPPPSFWSAMVQNTLAGNTLILNEAAVALIRQDPKVEAGVSFHDWWLYLRLSGAGATFFCDQRPALFYRQHAANALGASAHHRFHRLKTAIDGTYRRWVTRNLEAFLSLPEESTRPEYRKAAERLLQGHPRALALHRSGAQRSDFAGKLLLPAMAALGRF